MNSGVKSGKKFRQKIINTQNIQEMLNSEVRHRVSISPQKSQFKTEDIEHMANITYDRVLKNKASFVNSDNSNFQQFIQDTVKAQITSSWPQTYESKADVRDKRVRIPFQSVIYRQFQQHRCSFNCDLFLQQIRDWLVTMIEVVTSVSFNYLKKDELNLNQVKNFTSKNILLNIKQMFQKYNKLSLQNRYELMKFVNLESIEIFDHIMLKYPQNSGSSASKRVKSKISKIDNRQSDEFQFLRNNDIYIQYKENGDYSQDIMKVINKLVSFATDSFSHRDQTHQTNYQVFMEMMEYLFENAAIQNVSRTVQGITAIVNQRSGLVQNMEAIKNFAKMAFKLGQSLAINESNTFEKKETFVHESSEKDYLIGHKIPAGTKQFSDEQIQGAIFKSHDTAVLRILTKWVEQLYKKLENAEDAIYTRLYKFKDNKGRLVNVNLDLREQMYSQAREELKKVKQYMKQLRNENGYLETLFAGQVNVGKYAKLDTKIGTFASKVNEIGSQYIFKHINKLIHCLLTITKEVGSHRKNKTEKTFLESINLVTLKIGDLMRCKYSCSEFEFMKIIDVLQEFHLKNPQIIKIVRIKNRLQRKDNDILINLFWMNKVQCQIQLSIKGKINKIQKKYGDFCHLIYQITRARLGPISQMCSIVCQHDPLARTYRKKKQYGPQMKAQYLTKFKRKMLFSRIKQEIALKNKLNIGNTTELPFICRSCRRLVILTNPQFLYRQKHDIQIDCNQCRFEDLQSQKPLEAYQYIVNSTFPERDKEQRKFIVDHINFWDSQEFIKSLSKRRTSINQSLQMIPSSGLLLTTNQKKPKLMLFSTVLEQTDNQLIFAHVDNLGKQKIICKLTIKHEKSKQLEAIREQLKKLMIFQFKGVKENKNREGIQLQCFRSQCCGKTIRIGNILEPEQILQISQKNYLKNQIQSQKSVLRMNLINDAFRKLEQVVNSFNQKSKKTSKIIKSVQNIKAYKCGITNIQIVSRFSNLVQINISENYELQSLKGLQYCRYLKSLDVKRCNLQNLDDVNTNIRLKYINASKNVQLNNIDGLKDHLHLVELIINNTAIYDLSPLNSCPSLQILDIENCHEIDNLNSLNAAKISFLNTYGCSKLPQDPNQKLKNSILSKSHHIDIDMKRSTCTIHSNLAEIEHLSDSIVMKGKNPLSRSCNYGISWQFNLIHTLQDLNGQPSSFQLQCMMSSILTPVMNLKCKIVEFLHSFDYFFDMIFLQLFSILKEKQKT